MGLRAGALRGAVAKFAHPRMAQAAQIASFADGQHLIAGVVGQGGGDVPVLAGKVLMDEEDVHGMPRALREWEMSGTGKPAGCQQS